MVLPYIHNFSHRIKNIAARYEVRVSLSAPFRLKGLCRKVNNEVDETNSKALCQVKHRSKFVECVEGVVYKIPLSCGRSYVGQTGRCLNERLREHNHACGQLQAPGNLAAHCSKCNCKALLDTTSILARSKDRTKREIIEAFHMASGRHGACVSEPSLALRQEEIDLLNKIPNLSEQTSGPR